MRLVTALLLLFSSLLYASDEPQTYESVIKEYKGKVVYLDFWASWCTPCRKSFPWMNEMQEKYSGKAFSVVSINLDANKKLAKDFLMKTPANFPIVYDPDGDIASEMQLQGMPSSFLIDTDGKILSAHMGFTDKKKAHYEQEIIEQLQRTVKEN